MKRITIVENPNSLFETARFFGHNLSIGSNSKDTRIYYGSALQALSNGDTSSLNLGYIYAYGKKLKKSDTQIERDIKSRKNPYASQAQRRFFRAAEKSGRIPHAVVEEYDRESAGLELPEKANGQRSFEASIKTSLTRALQGKAAIRSGNDTTDALYLLEHDKALLTDSQYRKLKKYVEDYHKQKKNPNEAYLLTIASKRDAENLQSVNVIDVGTGKKLASFKSVIAAENFARRKGLKLLKNPKKNGKILSMKNTIAKPKGFGKIKTIKGFTIYRNTKKKMDENGGYAYSVYTKEEMEQPAGYRYSEMDFDNMDGAEDWILSEN